MTDYRTYKLNFLSLSLSLHFNGHFPCGPGLTGTRMYPFWILLTAKVKMVEMSVQTSSQMSPPKNQHPVFLQAGCPSCHPTNSVKAQKTKLNRIKI